MSTRRELRGKVKRLLMLAETDPDIESGSPTNTQINEAIEEARGEFRLELAILAPRRIAARTTLAYAADAESTALPAAAQYRPITHLSTVVTGGLATARYQLPVRSVEDFDSIALKGRPSVAAIEGTLLYLRPIPSAAQTVTIGYVPALTALGDSDSPSELPAELHHILAYKAAMEYQTDVNDENSDRVRMRHEALHEKLLEYFTSLADDTAFRQTVNPRY